MGKEQTAAPLAYNLDINAFAHPSAGSLLAVLRRAMAMLSSSLVSFPGYAVVWSAVCRAGRSRCQTSKRQPW